MRHRIRKRHYKSLGTSVINSSMSSPSLGWCTYIAHLRNMYMTPEEKLFCKSKNVFISEYFFLHFYNSYSNSLHNSAQEIIKLHWRQHFFYVFLILLSILSSLDGHSVMLCLWHAKNKNENYVMFLTSFDNTDENH